MVKRITLFILLIAVSCGQDPKGTDSEGFKVNAGTNVAHWLSQSTRRGIEREQFFTKSDVQAIASMGFDHIRLPIDEEQMWDQNGQRHKEAFTLLDNCIQWCIAHDLRVIVDLHILRSHHFNAKEKPLWTDKNEQEKFFDLWRDLSKALKKYPTDVVAYELMNEAVADDHDSWNELIHNAFAAIRKMEPKRTIVVGSNQWQSVTTFDALEVPENDKNILLSFHFYEPFLLSHYKANWTELKDYEGPVHYPGVLISNNEFDGLPETIKPILEKWKGVSFDKDVIIKMWQKPIQKAKELGLPLYCGEYGIIAGAPTKDAHAWYTDMVALFEQTGIAYCNWNYKSDEYGLIDNDGSENTALIQIISKKGKE